MNKKYKVNTGVKPTMKSNLTANFSRRLGNRKGYLGFTLVELMVVVVIGVIADIS